MSHSVAPAPSTRGLIIALLATALLLGACDKAESGRDSHLRRGTAVPDTFAFANLDEIRDYFVAAKYTIDDWRGGDRSVPRFYLASVPSRWRHEVAPNLPVQLKKRYFFFVYAPLVLEANETILLNRDRLLDLTLNKTRTAEDQTWLRDLAAQYFLEAPDNEAVSDDVLDKLAHRLDIVPPSLALAQAAVESGWSTSRFSDMGNALFGQWTWSGDGITPAEQRDHLGDYKIRAFDSPEQSIAAYMHNLNTHRSYRDFRDQRAGLRAAGQALTGKDLATTLTSYSEKGQEYVEMLLSVIRVNELEQVDATYLRDMKPVMLVPVGPGSD